MRSRTLTCITAMTLFAVLAIPIRVAAQEKQEHKHHTYRLIDMERSEGLRAPSTTVPMLAPLTTEGWLWAPRTHPFLIPRTATDFRVVPTHSFIMGSNISKAS